MTLSDRATRMAKVLAGFLVIWVVLDRSAAFLGSFRGESGLIVCGLVLVVATGVERVLFGAKPIEALRALGLRLATERSVIATLVLSAVLLGFFPLYAFVTGVEVSVRADWYWLLPGLFAQGGVAEETLFRGYLFRHMREGRSFRRAAILAAIPFVAVHLLLFATLDLAVAAASLALSVSISFPLAWLFERAGNSVWPPAILHFVIQGAIKLVEVPDSAMGGMAMAWIVLSTLAPWLLFVLRPTAGHSEADRR
jgi:membrane protease YdiL (CAAX protease family)